MILGVRASKIVHAAYEWFGIENMKADNKLRISSIFKHSYMVMHITLMNPADLSTSPCDLVAENQSGDTKAWNV